MELAQAPSGGGDYPGQTPEVGHSWAVSPDGGNISESLSHPDTFPGAPGPYPETFPSATGSFPAPYPGVGATRPAPYPRPPAFPPASLPVECHAPPPTCPVPWVRPNTRWYYDTTTATCSSFKYYCGEGLNNFHTLAHCSSYCQPSYSSPSEDTPNLTAETMPSYLSSHDNVLVEFYTNWCGACQMFAPKFHQIAASLRSPKVLSNPLNQVARDRHS